MSDHIFPLPEDFLRQQVIHVPQHTSLRVRVVNDGVPLPLDYEMVQWIQDFADDMATSIPPLSHMALRLKSDVLDVYLAQPQPSAGGRTTFVANRSLSSRMTTPEFAVGGWPVPTRKRGRSQSLVPSTPVARDVRSVHSSPGRHSNRKIVPRLPRPPSHTNPSTNPFPATQHLSAPSTPVVGWSQSTTGAPQRARSHSSAAEAPAPDPPLLPSAHELSNLKGNVQLLDSKVNNLSASLKSWAKTERAKCDAIRTIDSNVRALYGIVQHMAAALRGLERRIARVERLAGYDHAHPQKDGDNNQGSSGTPGVGSSRHPHHDAHGNHHSHHADEGPPSPEHGHGHHSQPQTNSESFFHTDNHNSTSTPHSHRYGRHEDRLTDDQDEYYAYPDPP